MQGAARTGYRSTWRDRQHVPGSAKQTAHRTFERNLRIRVLARLRWAGWNGWSLARVADAIGLARDTLAQWQRRWDDLGDRLAATPLGAPALTASPDQRRDVLDFIALFGSGTALATLVEHFPQLSRRDLACLLHCARQHLHQDACNGWYRSVTWNRPGAVWAMDHTEPPTRIDGIYRFVLTVRDLATGCTLAVHAVEHPDAASTILLLRALVAAHGAPLVIKADNGPAFIAHDLRDWCAGQRIALLLSPPYYPQFNGACEAGNGTIKRLAHDCAARHDRVEQWSLDDLEAARLVANHRRTDRNQAFTPQQRFAQRVPIADHERTIFHVAISTARARRLQQLGVASDGRQHSITADALTRHAITDALAGLGFITIRSRHVRPCNPQREVG